MLNTGPGKYIKITFSINTINVNVDSFLFLAPTPRYLYLSAISLYIESLLQMMSDYAPSSLTHIIESQPTTPSILPPMANKSLTILQCNPSTVMANIQIYKDVAIDSIVISGHKPSKTPKIM